MSTIIIAIVAVSLVLAVVALIREVRLRRALQLIVKRLLELWRNKTHG